MKGISRPPKPVRRTATLQTQAASPKLPPRQHDPRHTVERKGQYIHKREQDAGAIRTATQ